MTTPMAPSFLRKTSDGSPATPERFRCAVFKSQGAPLELATVDYRKPGKDQLVIKVHGTALSNNDAISEHGLLNMYATFPRTPGMYAVGEIVQLGPGAVEGGSTGGVLSALLSRLTIGKTKEKEGEEPAVHHRFKTGEKVIISATHQCLGEYCTGRAESTCPLMDNWPMFEQLVVATFGGKVLDAYERHAEEWDRKSSDERRVLDDNNDRIGFAGDGCIVVLGQGGYASLAYHLLRAEARRDERIVLVSTSKKHRPDDFGMPSEDYLSVGQEGLVDALRKMGGIKLAIATDQPHEGAVQMLDAMRYGGEMVPLTLHEDGKIERPIAHLIARSLVVRGPVDLHSSSMHRALRICEKHGLDRHVSIRKFAFTEEGVREAWDATKNQRDDFSANVVVFDTQGESRHAA
ncbi:hypothetical protein JCM10049v2_006453 [Rhodotorula toruloides]